MSSPAKNEELAFDKDRDPQVSLSLPVVGLQVVPTRVQALKGRSGKLSVGR